ncbi:MAG: acyl-CoA thioesterase [Verrucomicrobiales bacterium]
MENHRLVLPEHLNQYDFLFGGYLLMWVDEMAWMAASLDYPGCHFVTVGMRDVSFRKSVRGGSILRFETGRDGVGKTSVTYVVRVFRVFREEEEIFSTGVTLVHVDENGCKELLPKP